MALPLGIFSTIGVRTVKPTSISCFEIKLITPQAVAAPAISVFIVSIPDGDFKERPPESNITPFPISAIWVSAFLLYSPTKK